jgi:hypothetical protein
VVGRTGAANVELRFATQRNRIKSSYLTHRLTEFNLTEACRTFVGEAKCRRVLLHSDKLPYREMEFATGFDLGHTPIILFAGTNPTGELITSGLPVTWEQAGILNAATCITILPEVPHLRAASDPTCRHT